ncbi:Enoyl-CoA hydratase/isomerase [Sodalis praecaptivus]|uniref:Enoyl-CoA hydratase/isomerase n=1 Tax=Sodalis praecaptivus TaxID=1239307 RepID=W0HWT5_9GAMM|nr:enoyl-CoA hydratase [Sodalis praecaptivus]AHF76613.1 Enoyl-CoA hydratase/isomerase [Sodalis praecaptivus]
MTTENATILASTTGPIGWITFNDPGKHNAISMAMAQAVPDIIRAFEQDTAIRVIVVRGAGEKAFAAGSNISSFDSVRGNAEQNHHYHHINESAYNAVYYCAKPTIAMIHGYCIGGGLDFATSCDIRLCSDSAVFAIPAVRLGLGYGYEGQIRLNRIVGPSRGRDIFFTGRHYSAQEALTMGLVHEIIPAAHLADRVTEYGNRVAQNAPMTLAAIKRVFIELEHDESRRDMAAAQALIDACFKSDDYREGRAAFAQKRQPQFKGE